MQEQRDTLERVVLDQQTPRFRVHGGEVRGICHIDAGHWRRRGKRGRRPAFVAPPDDALFMDAAARNRNEAHGIVPAVAVHVEEAGRPGEFERHWRRGVEGPAVGVPVAQEMDLRVPVGVEVAEHEVQRAVVVEVHDAAGRPRARGTRQFAVPHENGRPGGVPLARIEIEAEPVAVPWRKHEVQGAVAVQIGERRAHVGAKKVFRMCVSLGFDVAQAQQVAEDHLVVLARAWVTDHAVPRFAGAIGVVPAAREVAAAVAVQVHQAAEVRQRDAARCVRVVPEQIPNADGGDIGRNRRGGRRRRRMEADREGAMLGIRGRPHDPRRVAACGVPFDSAGQFGTIRNVQHLHRAAVHLFADAGRIQQTAKIDDGVHGHARKRQFRRDVNREGPLFGENAETERDHEHACPYQPACISALRRLSRRPRAPNRSHFRRRSCTATAKPSMWLS